MTTTPHYDVFRIGSPRTGGSSWGVRRIDQPCRIGVFPRRKDAVQTARLLASWAGVVSIDGKVAYGQERPEVAYRNAVNTLKRAALKRAAFKS